MKGAQDIRRFRLLLRNMICIDLRGFFKKPSKSFKRSGNVQDLLDEIPMQFTALMAMIQANYCYDG